MNQPAYLTVFKEESRHFHPKLKEKLAPLSASETLEWAYKAGEEWCREFLGKVLGNNSDDPTLKVVVCLQQSEGKAKILEYWGTDKAGFLKALRLAAQDHNLINGQESWIIPFKTKDGTKLQYLPSIHAQYADWKMANPQCSLSWKAWSAFELVCWMKATGNHRAPGVGDVPQADNQADALKLISHGPGDKDYEFAGIQLIKTTDCSGGTITRESYWYNVTTLDEYAQNQSKKNNRFTPWSGHTRKTDPIEMYIKTAKRNFIKNDSGPVFLRAKSERKIEG